MAFGIYIHIPYCLQRCTYCDFATYEQSQILPPIDYLKLLQKEIDQNFKIWPQRTIDTLYFGGGTPSLVPAEILSGVIEHIKSKGFVFDPKAELTLEINPATLNHQKMEQYLEMGINRFSVGAQTFNDPLLKSVRREHTAKETRETLSFLKSYQANFSFDLLFALPGQSLLDLKADLAEVLNFSPQHVSPYCLTVPEGHVLYDKRPVEDIQVQMFDLIHSTLSSAGYHRYEISNYCRPGFESRHNRLYWDDQPYWGIGLSAHSYMNSGPDFRWGRRFWNPSQIHKYQNYVESALAAEGEDLLIHQSLTDFCHISMRKSQGLNISALEQKFGAKNAHHVMNQLDLLRQNGWVQNDGLCWSLTDSGVLLSNQVFAGLTFLQGELSLD